MKSNLIIVALIFLIFSVISFLTNILGPLVPDIIDSFDLSIGIAGFLPFSFFVAYGVMSIPSGILIERYSEKTVLIAGFVLAFVAALGICDISDFSNCPVVTFFDWYRHGYAASRYKSFASSYRRRKTFCFQFCACQFLFWSCFIFKPFAL